jgi:hypothetical protein
MTEYDTLRPEGRELIKRKGEATMSSVEKEERRISRRDFAKGAAVVGAGVLASCGPTPQVVKETVEVPVEVTKIVEKIVEVPAGEAAEAGPVVLEVFDPFGPLEVTQLFSPRLDTLEGKTIAYCEGTWMVGIASVLVKDLLQKQFPTVKFVDIPDHGILRDMTDAEVSAMIKEAAPKIDGAIVGNAG